MIWLPRNFLTNNILTNQINKFALKKTVLKLFLLDLWFLLPLIMFKNCFNNKILIQTELIKINKLNKLRHNLLIFIKLQKHSIFNSQFYKVLLSQSGKSDPKH
jgi:hypothetical protein